MARFPVGSIVNGQISFSLIHSDVPFTVDLLILLAICAGNLAQKALTWIIGFESQRHGAEFWHDDSILDRRTIEVSREQLSSLVELFHFL